MPQRSAFLRSSARRAGGVGMITINGVVVAGNVTMAGPLVSVVAPSTIRIDNANTVTVSNNPPLTSDLVTDTYNGFIFPKLTANTTVPIPTTPSPIGNAEGRKITIMIQQKSPAVTVTWTGGAGGFLFAPAGGVGIKQTDFDTLLAATPDGGYIKTGWEYIGALNKWGCVALAGWFI